MCLSFIFNSFFLMGKKTSFLCLYLFLGIAVSVSSTEINLWPMPQSVKHGSQSLLLSKDFKLLTEGSSFTDSSGILKDTFSRFLDTVKVAYTIDDSVTSYNHLDILGGINVVISSPDDQLQFEVDESYKLTIPGNDNLIYAKLEAQTVFGSLQGLQTLSQLCLLNAKTKMIEVHQAPVTIIDKPRFPFRGLLIDTSRHYQPLRMIKNVIDSMTYAKLNVLHWHIVDTESFPLEIPSFPKLWNGAYSSGERYTMADVAEVVKYAENRGVHVLAEIDVPGHSLSWGCGYPSLWPSSYCPQPLDVSNEFTFQVIDGILSDFSKVFKFKFIHLGGDEVYTRCWYLTPHIRAWLKKKGLNGTEAYQYFVLRAQQIALSHGYEIVNWEETFNNFGQKLSPQTVVHNWQDTSVARRAVASGLRCIVSNEDKWYLNHLDNTWQMFYMNEPLNNITDPMEQKLVIGGEVCMWGEQVDASNIQQTIWPRAAAAAGIFRPTKSPITHY